MARFFSAITALTALTALAVMVPGASAQARPLEKELPPGAKACWERAYDAAHLAKNPKQRVTSIRLIHLPGDWQVAPGQPFYVSLRVQLRDGAHPDGYQLGGFCKAAGKGLRCTPEWEAGSWSLESGPGGALVLRNHGMTVNPYPYDAEEVAPGARKVPARPADDVFRLQRASDSGCILE